MFVDRIKKLKKCLIDRNLDACLFVNSYPSTKDPNILYYSGVRFLTSAFILIPVSAGPVLVVQELDYARAGEIWPHELRKTTDIKRDMPKLIQEFKIKRLGISGRLPFSMAKKLGIKLVDIDKELYAIRAIKERGEIKKIKRAVRITKESVKEVLEEVRPGMREFEVGARLEFKFRSKGSDGAAFPTIVLSGKRSCHPHGLTSKRKILRGDVLLLDCGAKVEGYCADITRTIVIGKMQDNVKKHHDLVKKAQRAAIRSIKPGVVNVTVDAAARKIIKQAGFSIPHGIGHGIGLEVHERPSIAQKGYKGCKEEVLKPGMVFTIEPAIYITGKYGIRIEDDIIVTKNGYRVL